MSELFSRGEIKNGNSFHIVARVKNDVTGPRLSSKISGLSAWNTGSDTPGGKYFFLCQNQYRLGGNSQQRLYFSSDPEDFQPDYNHNSLNTGCVFFKATKGLDLYTLRYSTTLDKNNNKVPSYFKTISKNLNQQSMVNLSSYQIAIQFRNNNFNLTDNLFLSVPYNLNFLSNQNLQTTNSVFTNWVFRNVTGDNSNNINFYQDNSLISLGSSLVRGDVENLSLPLSSTNYSVSGNILTIKYSALADANKKILKKFSQNEGIIQINNEIIIYKTIIILGNEDRQLLISKRGAAGTTVSDIPEDGITIKTDIRNTDTNFTVLNNVDLSSILDFYIIPSTSIANFYKSRTLKNMVSTLVKPDTIKIYNRETGDNATEPKSRLFFNFLSYRLLNDLTTHWTSNGLTGFPQLAFFDHHNNEKSTLFTWENGQDAAAGFMFDYCNQNQNCGSCFGVTKFNSSLCYADSLTRNRVLNDEPDPLAIENRTNSTNSSKIREGMKWGFLAFNVILTILFFIVCARSYPKASGTQKTRAPVTQAQETTTRAPVTQAQ